MYGDSIKALREQRGEIVAQMRAITDKAQAEGRDLNAEERANFEKADKDQAALKSRVDTLLRVGSVDAEMRAAAETPGRDEPVHRDRGTESRQVQITPAHRALAIQGWMRAQSRLDLTDEQVEACRLTRTNPHTPELEIRLGGNYADVRSAVRQTRAGQNVGTASAGGDLVPQGFVYNLERALLQFGGMRALSDVMRTDSGNALPWPTVNDTSNKGSILSEATQVSGLDLTFGQLTFNAYKYTSGLVLVSAELLNDSAFTLADFIGSICGERIGRIQNDHFTTGTGTGQPKGWVTATVGTKVTTGSVGTLVFDDLLALEHAVDPAYRSLGASYMMHDQILLAVKKLKDSQGRYLWQPAVGSIGDSTPDTLNGKPVYTNQSMDSTVATGKNVAGFGYWPKYKIRDVASVRMRRLVERYADYDQEGFVMFTRADGNLLDAGTHPIKVLQVQ